MRLNRLFLPILLIVLSLGVRAQSASPQISAPDAILHDDPFAVTVTGLTPTTNYTLRTELYSGSGTIWRSEAQFRADAKGTFDTGRDAPVNGPWTDADLLGPFWTLQNTKEKIDNSSIYDNADQTTAIFQVRDGEKVLAQKQVLLRNRQIGVSTVELRSDNVAGTFYSPTDLKQRVPAVIVLPGSEGGVARPIAAMVASHGYPTLALAYFGFDKLPAELEHIPVETVDRAVNWLSAQPAVDPEHIIVMGGSKGAELALLSASLNKRVTGVIAYAPSSVVYEGIGNSSAHVSSWTSKGIDIPFAPYVHNDTYTKSRRLIDLYDPTFDAAPPESRIAVEKINGPILLLSGRADALWPSSRMADEMAQRLRKNGFKFQFANLQFIDVGHHVASIPLRPTADSTRLGGSARAIAHANVDAWSAIVEFLSRLKK